MEKIEIKVGNEFIRGVLENPKAKSLIIFAHGFSGDMAGPDNIFKKLSFALQNEKIAVLRFNFRGTAPSDGAHRKMTIAREVEDLTAVINFAKNRFFKIGILAESMGATVAAIAYDPILAAIVFWYPALDLMDSDFKNLFTPEARQELNKNGFIKMWGVEIGEKLIEEIATTNLYGKIKTITSPVLFLHGDCDSDVPFGQSQKAFLLADEPKELHILRGADHCFKSEQGEAIKLTVNFLRKYFSQDIAFNDRGRQATHKKTKNKRKCKRIQANTGKYRQISVVDIHFPIPN